MKELLKQVWQFILEALKGMEWKPVVFKICEESILPALKKLVDKSDSKIDDVIYEGMKRLVDVFLKPGVALA